MEKAKISICLVNLKAYKERIFDYREWVRLPCSAENMQRILERNHITNDSGWFISHFELNADLSNMKEEIDKCNNLNELNYVAAVIDALSDDDYKKFECIVSSGIESFSSVLDYVTLAQNLDCFDIIPAIDDEDLGRYFMEGVSLPNINDVPLSIYIDYKEIGRNFVLRTAGCGYGTTGLCLCNQSLPDVAVEVPEEYKIMPETKEAGSVSENDFEMER